MIFRSLRLIPVLALSAALFACSDPATTDNALPDIAVEQSTTAAPKGDTIVGLLKSADNQQVVLNMPDGSTRTFLVRPQDAPRLGIDHLASHAGLTDIGFEVAYETVDGKDYILGAQETAPPL
jgi:hypothetical protein